MKREGFGSRLGFLLVSAGCAIGIGNVWKFPYVAGQNGGGVFVVFYLLFLLLVGVPVLTMELAVGRAGRRGAVGSYRVLEKPGSKWHIHGWICLLGCLLLMMYYTTVAGWMLGYFFKFLTGSLPVQTPADTGAVFRAMLENPREMLLWMALMVTAGALVCGIGLQKGLERVTKGMMLCLLGLILVLGVNALTLPEAEAGLRFYLLPDLGSALDRGLGRVMVASMNQAFFTLSLGIASMEIFGSYMATDHTLAGEALRICALDTFVALMAGLIIFPACFSYRVAPDSGPSLIFVTLPRVFADMARGRLWGSLFFLFMVFASFSTVTAVFENLIAGCMENFGWSRKKAAARFGAAMLLLSLPALLGYNLWASVRPIRGMDILSSEDFLVSNLLLPIGALVFLLFCVTRWGWGFDNYLLEANRGAGPKLPRWLKPYFQFLLPVLILLIFFTGLIW